VTVHCCHPCTLLYCSSGGVPVTVHCCPLCIATLSFCRCPCDFSLLPPLYIDSLVICRRPYGCLLSPHLYIASVAFWRRPYGCPLLSPLNCFIRLLATPLRLSTVITRVQCTCTFTCLLSLPLRLSTVVTLTLFNLPSGTAPLAVHCSGPCIASLVF
jgi:hypothetical protein